MLQKSLLNIFRFTYVNRIRFIIFLTKQKIHASLSYVFPIA